MSLKTIQPDNGNTWGLRQRQYTRVNLGGALDTVDSANKGVVWAQLFSLNAGV